MLNNASEVIEKINESSMPAIYEADKTLQKVVQLKNKRRAKNVSVACGLV